MTASRSYWRRVDVVKEMMKNDIRRSEFGISLKQILTASEKPLYLRVQTQSLMPCKRCNCTSALQLIKKENICMGYEYFATTSTLKINNFSMIKIKVGKRTYSAAGNTPLVLLDAYQQHCTVSREATSARQHRWPEHNTGFLI